MMAAPRTQFEVRRSANNQLSSTESIALECLKQIAAEGRVVRQYEICAAIGSENWNGGTVAGVIKRLIDKGWIEHVLGYSIQRGLWLRIVATGQQTAEPECKVKHKLPLKLPRSTPVPSPAIHQIRERAKPLAQMIEAKARSLGKPVHEFLMDCVYVGFHEIMHDAEEV